MALIRPVARLQHGRAEKTDLRNLAGDAIDLHQIADPDAILTHQYKPAKERNDEVLQDQRESGSGETEDGGHLAGGAEDDKQDDQYAEQLYAEFEDDVQGFDAAPVEFRTIDEMAGQRVEENHADQNEGDQCERPQQQMLYDSMLQKYLRRPLAVNARELLLALDAIVADAENLAERAPPFQAGELVQAGSGRRGGLDLVCEVRMLGRESDYVGLSLPQGLLD